MTRQLEVIKFRDLVPVKSIPRIVPNLDVTTLEVVGEDFSNVELIYINDVKVPEFLILNRTTLWAQLPDNVNSVQTIEVQSSKFTRTAAASKISFQIGTRSRQVTGILKLVQLFTKWLLQSPGSDIFNQERGGGLQQIVGKITTSKKMEPVLTTITRAIDETSRQIRTSQARGTRIPLAERLMSANLEGVDIYEDKMMAVARVRLISMAGDDAITSMVM